jgi:hypothetical protein
VNARPSSSTSSERTIAAVICASSVIPRLPASSALRPVVPRHHAGQRTKHDSKQQSSRSCRSGAGEQTQARFRHGTSSGRSGTTPPAQRAHLDNFIESSTHKTTHFYTFRPTVTDPNLPDTAAATWPRPNFSRTFDRGVAATDLRGAHRRKRNQSFGVAKRQQQRNLNGEYLIGAVDCIHSHE